MDNKHLIKQIIPISKGEVLTENEKVIALGIQAPPGSQFMINGGLVQIGFYGFYELDLTNLNAEIDSIVVMADSPTSTIIDIVYTPSQEVEQ